MTQLYFRQEEKDDNMMIKGKNSKIAKGTVMDLVQCTSYYYATNPHVKFQVNQTGDDKFRSG